MNYRSKIPTILIAALILCAIPAYADSQFAGQLDAAAFAYGLPGGPAPLRVEVGNAATGSQTITLTYGQTSTADGITFAPLATTAPITIGIGAVAETVTPSAVTCTTPGAYATCTLTATFTYTHGRGDLVMSGTAGLQEAIDYATAQGGGTVLVGSNWTRIGGTTTILNAATLTSTVSTLDTRGGTGGSAIQTRTIAVSNAEVLTLYSVGKTLIPAQGAGSLIVVEKMVVENVYKTAAFAAGGAIQASYDTGVTTAATATIAATFLTSPTANQVIAVAGALASSAASAVLNKPITLAAASADFTTGAGSLIVKISYRVLSGF